MENVNIIDGKLFNSSCNGDIQGVVVALAQGGRVAVRGPDGGTPLLVAAQAGHTDICVHLLKNGSDVNEVQPETKMPALHLAASKGHTAVVEALLFWEAIVDSQDHVGMTPLYVACQGGHLACVLALLKEGASVSLPNDFGNLPIHVAAYTNRVDIVRALLDYGCSPDMVSCCDFNNNNDILSPFRRRVRESVKGKHRSFLQQLEQLLRQWPSFSPKEPILIS